MRVLARAAWAAERVISAVSSGAAQVARAARPQPPNVRITQYEPDNKANWSIPSILRAIEEHEDGCFEESAKLAAAFGRDDRISACRNTRTRALIGKNGATFDVIPSEDGDKRRVDTVCGRVKKLWFQCFTESAVTSILESIIDLGVSVSRIHWDRVGNEWRPRLEPWDMRWIRWDHASGCYIGQSEQGMVEIRPGTGEWLIIEPSGARSWMAGAVRALAMAFYFRAMTWKDWARYCEKHGVPILAIAEPPAEASTTQKSTKDSFFASLKRLGREGILRLPRGKDGKTGYDAKIVEPRTLSWPAFEAFLKRLDICIAIFLLGQNLSTEISGGSLAAAVSQNRVRLDYLAADAEALSTAFRSQVLMFWGRFNIEGWDDELAPWPKWDTAEPEDQKSKSTVIGKVASAIDTLKKASSPVDERALLEQFAIPLLTVEEFAKVQEEAAKRAADALKKQQKAVPKSDDDDATDDKAPAKTDDAEKTT